MGQVTIQRENKNISNKVEQKVLKDLKQYSLSLKYIAEENNISDNIVRNILKDHMKDYQKKVINLQELYHLVNLKQIINGLVAFLTASLTIFSRFSL